MSYETEVPAGELSTYTRPDHITEGYRSFEPRQVWRGVIEEDRHVSVENRA